VYLKTGFNLRYDNGIKLAKKLIDKKKIGKIYFIKIEYVNGSVKTNKNNVGSLFDIGSHSVNLFEFFINKKFKVLNNTMQKNEYFKDDNGFITIKSGAI
jgi:predicted dehydrogenase